MYQESEFSSETKLVKFIAIGVGVFILLLLVIALFPVVVIGAGERGVVFNNTTGVENRILGEGIHFRTPFVESVHTMSVKVQKTDVKAEAASKDLQTVNTQIVLNWHLDAGAVNKIYQSVGDEKVVIDRILLPNTSEVVKAVTAQYTAEETLTKRPDLKAKVDSALSERLRNYNIVLDDVSIVDINFSDGFNKAIEDKARAEQEALAEKNKLESFKYQAQQKIETARGEAESTTLRAKAEAEAIRIKAEALRQNPDLVNLNAVEKWNGVLPVNMYGSAPVPFVNIPK